jgi:hypothetical protein
LGRVRTVLSKAPFISSPLGIVPKSDFGYRRIHHLYYPPSTSVNDYIPNEYAAIQYTASGKEQHKTAADNGLTKKEI